MYRRILVATDSSPWADAAVDDAIGLATDPGVELCVLSVLPISLTWVSSFELLSSVNCVIETAERQSQALLDCVVDRANQLDVICNPRCTWGAVAETILHTASVENCGLIILGSCYVKGWKRRMLGATGHTVTAKSSQPILIVTQPPLVTFDVPLWRRLLVAAVAQALSLAQTDAMELHLLYVDG